MFHFDARGVLLVDELFASNLRPTLQLLEMELFETQFVFAQNSNNSVVTEDDVLLYERVLQVVLLHLPLRERRQHVLRLLLRYLNVMLPHPSCACLCVPILTATSSVLSDELGERTRRNLRVVRLALSFLNASRRVFLQDESRQEDAERVQRTMVSLLAYWGTQLFDHDVSVSLTEEEEATAESSLANTAIFEHQYSDAQDALHRLDVSEAAVDTQAIFEALCVRFVEVLDKRTRKMDGMLRDYFLRIKSGRMERRNSFRSAGEKLQKQKITADADVPLTLQQNRERNSDILLQARNRLQEFAKSLRLRNEIDVDNGLCLCTCVCGIV